MPTNLQLNNARSSNANLAFGGSTSLVTNIHAQANISLPQVGLSATAFYDVNVWRGIASNAAMPYQPATLVADETLLPQLPLTKAKANSTSTWQLAVRREAQLNAPWRLFTPTRTNVDDGWQQASASQAQTLSVWDKTARVRQAQFLPWQRASPLKNDYFSLFKYPSRRRAEGALLWGESAVHGVFFSLSYLNLLPRRHFEKAIPWDETIRIPHVWPRPTLPPVPQPLNPCLDPQRTRLAFANSYIQVNRALQFACWHVFPAKQITIPIRKVYIMLHNIEVKRLADNTPIHAASIEIGLDVDAWAWHFSATLLGRSALEAVQPDSNGVPVFLSVTINNYTWHLLVEEWQENRAFGNRSVSVRGRGLSAYLSAPYQLPVSAIANPSAMTIQQAMAGILPTGEGFSLNWASGLSDWLLPAGAWSYQSASPITALFDAAQQTGLVIIPSKAGKTLNVQARYPTLPWEVASATPSLTVPEAAILNMQRRSIATEQANAVYVHGNEVGGIFAQIKRTGSAGDKPAATQQNALITHVDAARTLGGRILAKYATQPTVKSVTMPLGGVYPLAEIGQLTQINHAQNERGIINAIQVQADINPTSISVRQTLTIGEDTPNEWAKFKRLLPESPLLAGQSISNNGDGTTTLQLIGGGLLRVRGATIANNWYYTRNGRIESVAPAFGSPVTIDI